MQYFRRVMVQSEGLARRAMGPLVYSGQFKRHPQLGRGENFVEWFVVFWFPVPEGKRDRRNLSTAPSRVPDAKDFELRALADGAIEEEHFNIKFPCSMPKQARCDFLLGLWRDKCRQRLGFVPDACENGAPVVAALADSLERTG